MLSIVPTRMTRRRFAMAASAGLVAAVAPRAHAVGDPAPARPPELDPLLPGARLQGQVRFRWFGFHVYDARLWSPVAVQAEAFAAQPFGLELVYARRLEGSAIAERSIDEMQRLAALAPAQRAAWRASMREAFPDVEPGDRLTGVHRPSEGASFFHNGRPTRRIDDAEFGRRFFAIWLSPQGAEPALRRALLGDRS